MESNFSSAPVANFSHIRARLNACQSVADIFRERGDWTTFLGTQVSFAVIYCTIFVLGTSLNSVVIVSVWRKRQLRSVRNLFIVSLSCSDIIVCLTSVITTPVTTFSKQWLFGAAMCKLIPLIQCMSICISTLTLTAIAIDRYILICHPTKPPFSRYHAIGLIVMVWAIGGSLGIPMLIHSTLMYMDTLCEIFCQELWPHPVEQKVYGISVLIFQFVLPFLIMGFCYARIFITLATSERIKSRRRAGSVGDAQAKTNSKKRQRTNKMLIAMCLVFVGCWSLQVLTNVLFDFGMLPGFLIGQHFFLSLVTHSIAMTSVFWNPLIYGWFNENFRRAFFELMPFLSKVFPNNSASDNACHRTSGNENETQMLVKPTAMNRILTTPLLTGKNAMDANNHADTSTDDTSQPCTTLTVLLPGGSDTPNSTCSDLHQLVKECPKGNGKAAYIRRCSNASSELG